MNSDSLLHDKCNTSANIYRKVIIESETMVEPIVLNCFVRSYIILAEQISFMASFVRR